MAKKRIKPDKLKMWQRNECMFLESHFRTYGSDMKKLSLSTGWSVPTLYRKLLEYQIR